MKVKLRLDPSAIKDFFVDHVEKLVLTVVVFVFLLFVYGAVGHERLDFTPSDLSQDAQNAGEHIKKADPKKFIEKLKSVDYLAESHRIRNPIQVEPYQYTNLWGPPLFGIPEPRVPQLYTVDALRGEAGYGAMTVPLPKTAEGRPAAAPGGAAPGLMGRGANAALSSTATTQVVGQRWVVLTGLIDLAKQMEAYRDAFGNTVVSKFAGAAATAAGLEPEYCWVSVQRVEISDDGKIDETKWQLVDSKKQLKIIGQVGELRRQSTMAGFGGRGSGAEPTVQTGDVAAAGFLTLSRYVTFPLPAVRDHRWGPEVAHPPEIPLQAEMLEKLLEEQQRKLEEAEKAQEEETQGPGTEKKEGEPEGPPDDLFPEPGAGPAAPIAPGAAAPGLAGGDRRRTGMQGLGTQGMGPQGVGMQRPGMGPVGSAGGARNLLATREPIQLFRFFDFSVEPGKRYRYRVCLWLMNPSMRVPPQFRSYLPAELAEERFLKSEWSTPSDIVTVPRDSRLLVSTVKSPKSATGEPTANLMLVHFDARTGEEKSLEVPDIVRGQLVNYFQEIEFTLPADPQGPDPPGNQPPQEPAGGNRKPKTETRRDFYHAESLMLDMLGGDRLTSRDQKLTRPGQILLLEPDGSLVVRGELDDAQSIAHFKPPAPTPPPDRATGPANPRPGGQRQTPQNRGRQRLGER